MVNSILTPFSEGRYMHQGVLIKKSDHKFHLLVLGGKKSKDNWLNEVISLDLTLFLEPKLSDKEVIAKKLKEKTVDEIV